MYHVYILYSYKDKRLYTGYCNNLKSRIERHNNGFVRATKNRRPLKLIHCESYLESLDAKRREKFLKGGKGKQELEIQLKELFKKLRSAAV